VLTKRKDMKLNLFQKVLASIGLVVFVVLLAGCPYSSSVPIDEGTVKISSGLEGQWMNAADKNSEEPVQNPTYFIITKVDKFHASAKKMEFSSTDSTYTETLYHLTFSDVNGETFMNALEDGGNTFNLYKFIFDEKKGEIKTFEVTDYIKESFGTSKELKDFIAKNKSNSYFFTNSIETYIRK
jgi:hypothetical protein